VIKEVNLSPRPKEELVVVCGGVERCDDWNSLILAAFRAFIKNHGGSPRKVSLSAGFIKP
jgi:hypothetical protein